MSTIEQAQLLLGQERKVERGKMAQEESSTLRQVVEGHELTRHFGSPVLITSLPSGRLTVAYPGGLPQAAVRRYSGELHPQDTLVWRAISKNRAVRSSDVWGERELSGTSFFSEWLTPLGASHAVVAPLEQPIIPGYPGAVMVFRSREQGAFSEADIADLSRQAESMNERLRSRRDDRESTAVDPAPPPMIHSRLLVLDSKLKFCIKGSDPFPDEAVHSRVLEDARERMARVGDKPKPVDRVSLADAHGIKWHFRVVIYPSYPAFSDSPVAFYCLTPTCTQWDQLRAEDFAADEDLARLIPAIRFIRQHFHRRANLVEVARAAGLSAFHFHRQFTRLLGITPKNLMLDFQICKAKDELMQGARDLAHIAGDCGFAHQSHFTSRFRQATGLTPTRWRRMAQEHVTRG